MSFVKVKGLRLFSKIMAVLLFGLFMVEVLVFSPKEIATPEDIKPAAKSSQNETNDEQWMDGGHLTATSESRKEWELWADRAAGSREGMWKLKKMKAKIFSKNDSTFFVVTGDHGTASLTSKNMDVGGGVTIHSSNGHTFKTNSVTYNSESRTLRTEDPVTMIGPMDLNGSRLNLEGQGLFADIEAGFIDIQNDVRVKKTLEDGRNVVIRSSKARFSSKTKIASFKDDVTVDIASTRITGPEAHFEYDGDKKTLTSMQVEGGVRISDVDKWATAKKVHMSFTKDRFVLNGAPVLVQNNDELRGEEIVFLDGGKTVQVRRARAKFDSNSAEEYR